MATSQHNRLNEKLREYWESVRQGRIFPQESDIDIAAVADIWDSCFLVKPVVQKDGQRVFRYDYLGKDLIDAFGGDVSNQEISDKLINPGSPQLLAGFVSVLDNRKPAEEQSEFTNTSGMIIKYRSCMFPLGTPDEGVNYILGGMKWKAF